MSPVAKFLIVAALVPGTVAAQPAEKSVGEIQQVLKAGQTVVVTDSDGVTIKGTLAEINDLGLVVQPKKAGAARIAETRPRTLSWDSLSTIQRVDRHWNGVLLGVWAGLSATAAWRIGCNRVLRSPDSSHERVRSCRAAATSGRAALSLVPIGALAGLLIDDRIGGERISVRHGGSRRFALRPTLSTQELSLAASVEFMP